MKAEIELTPQQWKRLNELARERSITLSQLLEAIVNQALTENALEDWEELKRRALSVVGQFRGAPDLSQNHDEYWEWTRGCVRGYISVPRDLESR